SRLALDHGTLPTETDQPGILPPAAPMVEPTVTYAAQEPMTSAATEVESPGEAGAFSAGMPATTTHPEEGRPAPAGAPRPPLARTTPWVIPLVIAPLAFYSFMATLYILDTKFFHVFTPPPPPHPLEILPDIEGDNKGGARRGGRPGSITVNWPSPEGGLPPGM